MSTDTLLKAWNAALYTTLNRHHTVARVALPKAAQLAQELCLHKTYYLCLQAGYDVEVVRVLKVQDDIVTLLRGQSGTMPNIWPAGTWLRANNPAPCLPHAISLSWDLYY